MNPAILMVDDEKTVLDGLKGQLRTMFGREYLYETAEDAAEAWEVLEELRARGVRVVVVVSDWLMPGKRGDEFLAEVRARYADIGLILLTGQADDEAVRSLRLGNVCEVIRKPWSPDALRASIESTIKAQSSTG